ncbi:hypothetical protein SNE40_014339 [Patella caerulea]|uniref:Tyr recombinase domain-containing protein n=1 Tax=Patella caerulea TaxID=87958 RepID=A0AAN8JEB0_PATCE
MCQEKSCFMFGFDTPLKTSRSGHPVKELKMCVYPMDNRLCIYVALKEYLKRTSSIRGDVDKLFVSYVKPHREVSRETIARWIRVVLDRSGVDIRKFTAHSVRAAAVSKDKINNVSIDDIIHYKVHSV